MRLRFRIIVCVIVCCAWRNALGLTSDNSTRNADVSTPEVNPSTVHDVERIFNTSRHEDNAKDSEFKLANGTIWSNDDRAFVTQMHSYTGVQFLSKDPVSSSYSNITEQRFTCCGSGNSTWKVQAATVNVTLNTLQEYFSCQTVKIRIENIRYFATRSGANVTLRCTDAIGYQDLRIEFLNSRHFRCNRTADCERDFHYNSICDRHGNQCLCPNIQHQLACLPTVYVNGMKENAIMKAAMVAVACFTVVVISVFILFFYNRAKICSMLGPRGPGHGDFDRGDDVFTVSDQLARERLADKPPTYQDVVRTDRIQRGVPPPVYSMTDVNRGGRRNSSRVTNVRPGAREDQNEEHVTIARLAAELQRIGQHSSRREQAVIENQRTRSGPQDNSGFVPDS